MLDRYDKKLKTQAARTTKSHKSFPSKTETWLQQDLAEVRNSVSKENQALITQVNEKIGNSRAASITLQVELTNTQVNNLKTQMLTHMPWDSQSAVSCTSSKLLSKCNVNESPPPTP